MNALSTRNARACTRAYEPMTSRLFGLAARGAKTVVDVGAHRGHFSQLAIDAGAQMVIALEPQREIYDELCARMSSPRFTPMPFAAAEESGWQTLHFSATRSMTASLVVADWHNDHEQVQTFALDDLAFRIVDVLKIDVEGAEPRVIRGANQLIRRSHPFIFLEVLNDTIGQRIEDALPIPYRYFRIYEESMSVHQWPRIRVGDEWGNYMLLPAELGA